MSSLTWLDLGLISYAAGLKAQDEASQSVLQRQKDGIILTLEHHPVITLGRHAAAELLQDDMQNLCVQTDRGGKTTVHNPGQLVCYPILSVERFSLTPKKYVWLLENIVIESLDGFGIKAARDSTHPGIWVRGAKICALGIRIQQRVTRHGFALNVCNDLSLFSTIVPCGIVDRKVTSVYEEGVRDPSLMTRIKKALVDTFLSRLNKENS